MNHRQKLVQQQFLNDEEKVIKRLKSVYDQSMKDINEKISVLDKRIDQLQKAYADIGEDGIGDLAAAVLGSKKKFTPEEAKETLQSMIQSKVYQKTCQQGLQKQVGDVLDKMHVQQFQTVSDYLDQCYENGFIGTMFDLQGQGIPLCFPMDQEQMVRAVQLDSKIVEGYYRRMGENISVLKKRITAEVSRGISSGMRWEQVAQQLAGKTTIGYTNAIRIARTEGHRIQCQAGMDACHKAKDMGADVVKQWDSTLDGKTRDSHARVDGEIRELDEKFSNGLMFPGDPNGIAAEVINCRCALLQRARWALGEGFTKRNNFSKQLETFDSPESYTEFKKGFFSKENVEYMNYVDAMSTKYGTRAFAKVLDAMTEPEYKQYSKLLNKNPIFNKNVLENLGKEDTITSALTNEETITIFDYISAHSYNINGKLRTGTPLEHEEKEFVKKLNEVLDKMPTYSGDLQRSLVFDDDESVQTFLTDYTPGSPIKYKEFISTTKGSELYNPDGQVQIIIRNSKNGKDISAINEKEQEVLYKTDSEFIVIDIAEKDGKHYILLEEKSHE